MMLLNYKLFPKVGIKNILMNSFSNIYLQIYIKPVSKTTRLPAVDARTQIHWLSKWSVFAVELVLQYENLVILVIVLVGFPSFHFAKRIAW